MSRGGERPGAGRRRRPEEKIGAAEAQAFLRHVDEVRRVHRASLLEACCIIHREHIEYLESDAGGPVIEFAPFNGEIDWNGWVSGAWLDDPGRLATTMNYDTPGELRKLYHRLSKALAAAAERRRA